MSEYIWTFGNIKTWSRCNVEAQTWHAARTKAAVLLGCAIEELVCLVNPRGGPINVQ